MHQILFQWHHLYSGAKFNVISLCLAAINLTLASGNYFSICLKWVKTSPFWRFGDLRCCSSRGKLHRNSELVSSLNVVEQLCIRKSKNLRNQELMLMQNEEVVPEKQLL